VSDASPTTTTPVIEVKEAWHASDWLWAGGVGMLGLAGQAITVLFLTLFMLIEDDAFKRKLVHQMETLGSKRVTVQILNDIERQIERFIWVQAMTSAGVALVTGVTLMYLGVDAPAVWGLFAGLMNIVPYFGPLVVTAVLAIVGFLQFGTPQMATVVAGAALVITSAEGMILTPHLLSRATSLNHVAIFVALAFWSWAWGIPGMLLAVPMLVTLKAICDHVEGFKAFGDFLGD
jgi:predicted PurR-regulated permease PerM